MDTLPDYLENDLKIIFVGYNPSIGSSRTGHHYANPTNRFWKILYNAGLTPRLYHSDEDGELLKLGYGLTNIVERPTKGAEDISSEEYQKGRVVLAEKINTYKPKLVCFVGKGVYQAYTTYRKVDWGKQKTSQVEGVIDFVAPSSSGLVRMKTEIIVNIYRDILNYIS